MYFFFWLTLFITSIILGKFIDILGWGWGDKIDHINKWLKIWNYFFEKRQWRSLEALRHILNIFNFKIWATNRDRFLTFR